MKLKELFYLAFRPKQKQYPHEEISIEGPGGQPLQWAQWQHPKTKQLRPRLKDLPVLKKWLKPGDFTIDIGAHVGDTTLPQALAVGPTGLTLAFEPNPNVFEVLQANSSLNPELVNIHAVNAATMPEEGTFTFSYGDPGLCNGGYQKGISFFRHASCFDVQVKGIELNRFLEENYSDWLPKLRLIKSDTEGFDYQLFCMNRPLIEKYRPIIQAEVNRNTPLEDRKAFYHELVELNYDLFMLEGEALDSLVPAKLERFGQGDLTFDLVAVPNP